MEANTPEQKSKAGVVTDSPIDLQTKTEMHFYDLTCKTIDGKPFSFSELRGKVLKSHRLVYMFANLISHLISGRAHRQRGQQMRLHPSVHRP